MKQTPNNLNLEQCVRNVGSKFDLILIAAVRVRELTRGRSPLLKTDHKPCLTALTEIEHGLVGRELLNKVGSRRTK